MYDFDNLIVCSNCRSNEKISSNTCSNCGEKLVSQRFEFYRTCPKCGNNENLISNICHKCDASLIDENVKLENFDKLKKDFKILNDDYYFVTMIISWEDSALIKPNFFERNYLFFMNAIVTVNEDKLEIIYLGTEFNKLRENRDYSFIKEETILFKDIEKIGSNSIHLGFRKLTFDKVYLKDKTQTPLMDRLNSEFNN